MNLVDRIKGIVVEPRNEWPKIAAEPATVQSLYTGWIMILAAVGPIAVLLTMHSVQFAIAQYLLALIITFVLALIVDALAPSFGGTKDSSFGPKEQGPAALEFYSDYKTVYLKY